MEGGRRGTARGAAPDHVVKHRLGAGHPDRGSRRAEGHAAQLGHELTARVEHVDVRHEAAGTLLDPGVAPGALTRRPEDAYALDADRHRQRPLLDGHRGGSLQTTVEQRRVELVPSAIQKARGDLDLDQRLAGSAPEPANRAKARTEVGTELRQALIVRG